MSFLKDLESFSKNKLKPTNIKVVSKDGKVTIETRSPDGFTTKQTSTASEQVQAGQFFVIDDSKDPVANKVVDYVYISSQDAAHNWDELKAHDIHYILNVAIGVTNAFPQDLTYLNLEIYDIDDEDVTVYFATAHEFMARVVAEQKGVLVHCNAGVSRSATIVLSYLMANRRMRLNDAMDLLKKARPKIQPNAGFLKQLQKYDQILFST